MTPVDPGADPIEAHDEPGDPLRPLLPFLRLHTKTCDKTRFGHCSCVGLANALSESRDIHFAALAALPAPVPARALTEDEQHVVNGCRTLDRQFDPQTDGERTLLALVMQMARFVDRLTSAAPVPERVPEEGVVLIDGDLYRVEAEDLGDPFGNKAYLFLIEGEQP